MAPTTQPADQNPATLSHRVSPGTSADLRLATGTDKDRANEAGFDDSCDLVTVSQRSWHDARKYVGLNQAKLHARAVELYAPPWRLPRAPMLAQSDWLPDTPIALENIKLEWEPTPPKPITWAGAGGPHFLPLRTPRRTFPSYSSAIRYLSPPGLFENRPCYRLLEAPPNGQTQPRLRFGQSTYFDKIDMSEALVHGHDVGDDRFDGCPAGAAVSLADADPFDSPSCCEHFYRDTHHPA